MEPSFELQGSGVYNIDAKNMNQYQLEYGGPIKPVTRSPINGCAYNCSNHGVCSTDTSTDSGFACTCNPEFYGCGCQRGFGHSPSLGQHTKTSYTTMAVDSIPADADYFDVADLSESKRRYVNIHF